AGAVADRALGRSLRLPGERQPDRIRGTLGGRTACGGLSRGEPVQSSVRSFPAPHPMQDQILDALRRGANDEALSVARTAVDAEPQSARAQQGLTMALSASGDRDAALQSID